jgi:predicted kinase
MPNYILYFYYCCLLPAFVCADSPSHFSEAYQGQLKTFQHLDITHPKLMIFFSGVPGMGKTTVATLLEEKLHGIRVSSDEARHHLRQHVHHGGLDSTIRLEEYLQFLIQQVENISPNHLLIIDRSIDGIEEQMFALAEKLGYPVFVIRLSLPKKEVVRRLEKREEDPTVHQQRLQRLDRWFDEYEKFPIEKVDFFIDMTNFKNTHLSFPFDEDSSIMKLIYKTSHP